MLVDAPPTLLNTIIHKKHLSHFMAKSMNGVDVNRTVKINSENKNTKQLKLLITVSGLQPLKLTDIFILLHPNCK